VVAPIQDVRAVKPAWEEVDVETEAAEAAVVSALRKVLMAVAAERIAASTTTTPRKEPHANPLPDSWNWALPQAPAAQEVPAVRVKAVRPKSPLAVAVSVAQAREALYQAVRDVVVAERRILLRL
jgi:hypothetical protein